MVNSDDYDDDVMVIADMSIYDDDVMNDAC